MGLEALKPDEIIEIHDRVINPGELQGLALDKSLESALARVENRIAYGMIDNAIDLAAMYAVAIATGHVFNDANKRTAFHALETCLRINGIDFSFDTVELGDTIISVAQGQMDEEALAQWLRARV